MGRTVLGETKMPPTTAALPGWEVLPRIRVGVSVLLMSQAISDAGTVIPAGERLHCLRLRGPIATLVRYAGCGPSNQITRCHVGILAAIRPIVGQTFQWLEGDTITITSVEERGPGWHRGKDQHGQSFSCHDQELGALDS